MALTRLCKTSLKPDLGLRTMLAICHALVACSQGHGLQIYIWVEDKLAVERTAHVNLTMTRYTLSWVAVLR